MEKWVVKAEVKRGKGVGEGTRPEGEKGGRMREEGLSRSALPLNSGWCGRARILCLVLSG